MNIEWASLWLGVAATPVAAVLITAIVLACSRLLSKNGGVGVCPVCDRGFTCDIGDYTRLGIWIRSRKHNWFLRNRKSHRDAWARNRWNPYRLPGYPEDNGMAAERRPKPNVFVRAFWAVFA